jgi:two-component system, NtrC family, C4-dicarboxylate transport sensor histidine kinase DctB
VSPSEPLTVDDPGLGRAARELEPGDLVFANRLITLEQVLPNVTHEINNALQVIGGLGEIMAARAGVAEDVAQKLQRIHSQAVRCSSLLRELVTYARRDGAAPTTDVARGVDRALNLRRYHLSRARVTVHVEPETPGVVTARMDSQHFEQLLVNLVLNAEQATAGGADPTVRIAYRVDQDRVVLRVADNGPGIDTTRAEEYFQPFMTTRPGAIGLGLTAARTLVHVAGGSIRFVEPSVVEVQLPAR